MKNQQPKKTFLWLVLVVAIAVVLALLFSFLKKSPEIVDIEGIAPPSFDDVVDRITEGTTIEDIEQDLDLLDDQMETFINEMEEDLQRVEQELENL